MDEEIQQAENIDVQETDVTESPAVEEQPEAQQAEPVVEEPTEEPKARNGAQSRIKELVSKTKQLEAERNQYADLLQQANNSQVPENLSEDEYRALQASATYAATEVQQLKRQMAQDKFSNEVDLVEQTFPELNPNSEQYNEKLADTLAKAYEEAYLLTDQSGQFVGTKKSLKDFTEAMITPYRDAMTRGAVQTGEALDRQAAEAVVTPQTSTSSEPKPFADLSIKEMEARLGTVRN